MANTPFHIMAKPIGPICNLDCRYCFYVEKESLYPGTNNWAMARDVLETYIRNYIQAQPAKDVYFGWQGGEPTLLGIDFFRRAVQLQQQYASGKAVHNAFQTNGVLLNDEWGNFLAENQFLVGISIDGPRELHDYYRLDKARHSTFDRVMRGMKVLQRHEVEFNTLTVVNATNSRHPLEVYRFLKEIGSRFIQFIPVVERQANQLFSARLALPPPGAEGKDKATIAPWSVDAKSYGEFLCAIFDEWVLYDVGRYFIQHFDVALENWMGMQSSLCVFSEKCGAALVIEHTGDVYSCDHFVYPEYRLGNILCDSLDAIIGSEQQRRFGEEKLSKLPAQCLECAVRFACHGECPKHRLLATSDGELGLNYLCVGLKKFFTHVEPYMTFMCNELKAGRSPASVMFLATTKGKQAAQFHRPGRNDPCPCGSGKKAKRCCYPA